MPSRITGLFIFDYFWSSPIFFLCSLISYFSVWLRVETKWLLVKSSYYIIYDVLTTVVQYRDKIFIEMQRLVVEVIQCNYTAYLTYDNVKCRAIAKPSCCLDSQSYCIGKFWDREFDGSWFVCMGLKVVPSCSSESTSYSLAQALLL